MSVKTETIAKIIKIIVNGLIKASIIFLKLLLSFLYLTIFCPYFKIESFTCSSVKPSNELLNFLKTSVISILEIVINSLLSSLRFDFFISFIFSPF